MQQQIWGDLMLYTQQVARAERRRADAGPQRRNALSRKNNMQFSGIKVRARVGQRRSSISG
jgi:hypothetical protein